MLKKKIIIINNLLLDLNILISCMNILENCEWSIDSMHLKTGLIFLVICLALQVQESRGKFIYKRIILINFNRLGGGKWKDRVILWLSNYLFGIWCLDNSDRDSTVGETDMKLEMEMLTIFLMCVPLSLHFL